MSEAGPSKKRQLEGLAELLRSGVSERDLNDRRNSPDGISERERLTERYGPEGIGWDIQRKPQTAENGAEHLLHKAQFGLANEALRNSYGHFGYSAEGRGYVTDDGINVTGKVQAYVRDPGLVDIVVYPAGKAYEKQKFDEAAHKMIDGEK